MTPNYSIVFFFPSHNCGYACYPHFHRVKLEDCQPAPSNQFSVVHSHQFHVQLLTQSSRCEGSQAPLYYVFLSGEDVGHPKGSKGTKRQLSRPSSLSPWTKKRQTTSNLPGSEYQYLNSHHDDTDFMKSLVMWCHVPIVIKVDVNYASDNNLAAIIPGKLSMQ